MMATVASPPVAPSSSVSVPAKSGIVKKLVIAFVVVAVVVLVVVLSVWNKNEPAPAAAVSSGAASAGTQRLGPRQPAQQRLSLYRLAWWPTRPQSALRAKHQRRCY